MQNFNDLLFLAAAMQNTEDLLHELGLEENRALEISDVLDQKGKGLAAYLQRIPEGKRLLAALELGRRFMSASHLRDHRLSDNAAIEKDDLASPILHGPADAAHLAQNCRCDALALLLQHNARLIRTLELAVDSPTALASEIGVCALQHRAAKIVLVLKHPLELRFIFDVEERLLHLGLMLVDVISLSEKGYASLQNREDKNAHLKATSPWEASAAQLQPT